MNAPLKIGGLSMIRISLPYMFNLSTELEQLENLPDADTPYRHVFLAFIRANAALTELQNNLYTPYLRASWQLRESLATALREQLGKQEFDRTLAGWELLQIKNSYNQCKIALLAELGTFNSYFITQKGGYDMYSLLGGGEVLFPTDLAGKVPEALIDAREAAKALAYETPTACGFHTFRVIESVLRRYYGQVTNGKAAPKVRNIGVYLHALKLAKAGDEKILAAIKQITDLHRNPLIHPDVVLTMDEALATLGIARSVTTAMLTTVLPVIPPTTTTAVATTALATVT